MESVKGKPHLTICTTDKYDLFVLHKNNRDINPVLVRKKVRMLQQKGWCRGLPMLCRRTSGGKFEVIDGQHRLEAAKALKIPVWYTVDDKCEIEPSECNADQKPWSLSDYVSAQVAIGNSQFIELKDFAAQFKMPLALSVALLSGRTNHCTVDTDAMRDGTFVVKDAGFAGSVGAIVRDIGSVFQYARTRGSVCAIARFVVASSRGFQSKQLVDKCVKYQNMLRQCGSIDQYGEMYEEVYNFQQRIRLPIKFLADEEVRKRSFGGNAAK